MFSPEHKPRIPLKILSGLDWLVLSDLGGPRKIRNFRSRLLLLDFADLQVLVDGK